MASSCQARPQHCLHCCAVYEGARRSREGVEHQPSPQRPQHLGQARYPSCTAHPHACPLSQIVKNQRTGSAAATVVQRRRGPWCGAAPERQRGSRAGGQRQRVRGGAAATGAAGGSRLRLEAATSPLMNASVIAVRLGWQRQGSGCLLVSIGRSACRRRAGCVQCSGEAMGALPRSLRSCMMRLLASTRAALVQRQGQAPVTAHLVRMNKMSSRCLPACSAAPRGGPRQPAAAGAAAAAATGAAAAAAAARRGAAGRGQAAAAHPWRRRCRLAAVDGRQRGMRLPPHTLTGP